MKDAKKQVISLFDIQKMIYGSENLGWIKSAPKPSAQSTTLCESGTNTDALSKRIWTVVAGKSDAPVIFAAVLELLIMHGLRISEVLSIEGKDISSQGHIKIKGGKGSNDRIVTGSMYREFWVSMRKEGQPISYTFNRFWFYREMKKRGITLSFGPNTKQAVTHAPRHLAISSASQVDEGLQTTQKFIGHKNIKSTQHYGKKTKK